MSHSFDCGLVLVEGFETGSRNNGVILMQSPNSRVFFDEDHVQKLVAKIQNGQVEFFEKLWMSFSKYVFWIMRSPTDGTKSLDEAAANLLTTNVCAKLFENIGKYTRKKDVSFIKTLLGLTRYHAEK